MFNLKSLYFRMTIIHLMGIFLLPLNALLFTSDYISQIIQILLALALIVHELDERKNGNNLSKELIKFLRNMDNKNVSLKINTSMASEYSEIKDVVDIREEQLILKEQEESILIQEAKQVMNKLKHGDYSEIITSKTSNPSLEEFKESVNDMILETKQHFSSMNNILEKYINYDYTKELKLNKISDDSEMKLLVIAINKLKEAITQMLLENKTNGKTLQSSADILLNNVDKLNNSSYEAASSLNNTAVVLEDITHNIMETSNKTLEMSSLSNAVVNSAKCGEDLAFKTNNAMDEINKQVTDINEAICVIDQIAFQTNILSLNAAVEAATAGDAGKGFAVVAQEVRNLANKSTEAAKEIKHLVERANIKANEGKSIAQDMIEGYNSLNNDINKTIDIIGTVSSISKNQQTGIHKINDAMNILEEQIKANTEVSSQTNTIAKKTSDIANKIFNNANEKKFEGK
ncbi:methyl-accepting chemotaxis protein [Arcobacter sp. YIC-80]|uniref:methyl-accepting chemotaxis protein n=1 Tax=Arcobacter sp. YIC-80 TaxID=3376683 RepID=UPI003850187A